MAKSPSCLGEITPCHGEITTSNAHEIHLILKSPHFSWWKSPIFSKNASIPEIFPRLLRGGSWGWQALGFPELLDVAAQGCEILLAPRWDGHPESPTFFWANEDWWCIYIYIYIYISNYKHHSFMMFYGVMDQLLTYSKMFKGSCYRPFKNNLHSERVSGEPSPLTSQPANLHGQVSPASTSATHRMLLGKAARKKRRRHALKTVSTLQRFFKSALKMVEILDKPPSSRDLMPFHHPHVANSHNLGDPRLDQATLAGISSFPPSRPVGCGMIL